MKRNARIGCSIVALLGVGFFWLVPTAPLSASAQQEILVSVDNGRPLAAAVAELERRFHWTITYEDPLRMLSSEMLDVTETVRRDGNMTKRVFVPRGGPFEFRYQPRGAEIDQQEAAILNALVEQYNLSGHDGVFSVVPTGTVYHVIPRMVKDRLAALQPYRSLLDTRITLPRGDRRVLEMLEAIVSAVNPGSPRVGLGTVPVNFLYGIRVLDGVDNETARTALLRTLNATGRKLSWRLLCEPGPTTSTWCLLNIHFVEAPPKGLD